MSFINKFEFLEEKIYEIMKNNIEKIKNGYEISNYEIKKNPFNSPSKIICKNGFTGTLWDIEEPLLNELSEYKKSIERNGFLIENIRFFIDIKKININKLNVNDIQVILIKKK